ncbi:hypothetical protein N7451_011714 [Penicillium sp. IBT 35674x]|nr:hypothetical protein N7451_011714 [Penicillium sp. IBT 35674x]
MAMEITTMAKTGQLWQLPHQPSPTYLALARQSTSSAVRGGGAPSGLLQQCWIQWPPCPAIKASLLLSIFIQVPKQRSILTRQGVEEEEQKDKLADCRERDRAASTLAALAAKFGFGGSSVNQ